jgi:hypothetical protein
LRCPVDEVRSHHDHAAVGRWWNGQEITLSGHALTETYSVLTRLRGDARLARASRPLAGSADRRPRRMTAMRSRLRDPWCWAG